MKKRRHFHHLWLILVAYGVWFAVFSGVEEILSGKFWKEGFGGITWHYYLFNN